MTHTDSKTPPFQKPRKNSPTGAGMGTGGCFLTLPAKTAHRPTQAGQRGNLALPAVDLPDIFSVPTPKVFFFIYAVQVLHKAILPSSTLITFYRTLLEYYGSLFCFLRCDRMRFPQAASKLVQIGVAMSLGIVSLPRPGKPHTSPHSRSRRAFLLSFRTRCFFPLHIQGCFL